MFLVLYLGRGLRFRFSREVGGGVGGFIFYVG